MGDRVSLNHSQEARGGGASVPRSFFPARTSAKAVGFSRSKVSASSSLQTNSRWASTMLEGAAQSTLSRDTAANHWKARRGTGSGLWRISESDKRSSSMFIVTDGRFAPVAGEKSILCSFVSVTVPPFCVARCGMTPRIAGDKYTTVKQAVHTGKQAARRGAASPGEPPVWALRAMALGSASLSSSARRGRTSRCRSSSSRALRRRRTP